MDLSGFCTGVKPVLQAAGWLLLIFKIIIPLIIVGLGALDLGKAVTASKDDEIKKSAKSLGMRIVAGILIFLAPSVILWVFGIISDFSEAKDAIDFPTCQTCLLTPYKC